MLPLPLCRRSRQSVAAPRITSARNRHCRSREILRPPLNVEDAVGSSATYRCEYAEPAVDQIQVVPIRVDGVVVGEPWQALVGEGRIGGRELRIAVGRQIDRW